MKPLHRINPLRLGWLRDTAAAHFERDSRSIRPFDGLTLLDIGCGGGLLSEPLAKQGFAVTGIDPAGQNVAVAAAHAAQGGVTVDYRAGLRRGASRRRRGFRRGCWRWRSSSMCRTPPPSSRRLQAS